jgi:hypothetical protein
LDHPFSARRFVVELADDSGALSQGFFQLRHVRAVSLRQEGHLSREDFGARIRRVGPRQLVLGVRDGLSREFEIGKRSDELRLPHDQLVLCGRDARALAAERRFGSSECPFERARAFELTLELAHKFATFVRETLGPNVLIAGADLGLSPSNDFRVEKLLQLYETRCLIEDRGAVLRLRPKVVELSLEQAGAQLRLGKRDAGALRREVRIAAGYDDRRSGQLNDRVIGETNFPLTREREEPLGGLGVTRELRLDAHFRRDPLEPEIG